MSMLGEKMTGTRAPTKVLVPVIIYRRKWVASCSHHCYDNSSDTKYQYPFSRKIWCHSGRSAASSDYMLLRALWRYEEIWPLWENCMVPGYGDCPQCSAPSMYPLWPDTCHFAGHYRPILQDSSRGPAADNNSLWSWRELWTCPAIQSPDRRSYGVCHLEQVPPSLEAKTAGWRNTPCWRTHQRVLPSLLQAVHADSEHPKQIIFAINIALQDKTAHRGYTGLKFQEVGRLPGWLPGSSTINLL